MCILKVPAPAKLNLFLHLTGRRPDGYHNLQSAFVLINLCDELEFELIEEDEVRVEIVDERAGENSSNQTIAIPNDQNLVFLAATKLKEIAKLRGIEISGVLIRVYKKIPLGAGLGGGSSDCASTLMALNKIWDLGLSCEELMQIGLSLGADIPFFIGGKSALVEGIGEILKPFDLNPLRFVLINPGFSISTPQVFTHPNLNRNFRVMDSDALEKARAEINAGLFYGSNYLESAAFEIRPELAKFIEFAKPLQLRMSGSGSSIFSMHKSFDDAETAYSDLLAKLKEQKDIRSYECGVYKSYEKHPIFDVI